MKRFCIFSLGSHLNVLTFSPQTGGCSEGLGAFRFFFEEQLADLTALLRHRNPESYTMPYPATADVDGTGAGYGLRSSCGVGHAVRG